MRRLLIAFLAVLPLVSGCVFGNEQIRDEVAAELVDAVAFADESPLPEPKEALEDLFVNQ